MSDQAPPDAEVIPECRQAEASSQSKEEQS